MSEDRTDHVKSRLRFWVWLLVWSFALATVEQSLLASDRSYWDLEQGVAVNGMRLVTVFLFLTIVNLIASYLAVQIWNNRPTSTRTWLWLGMSSVALSILWIPTLCLSGVIGADDFTWTHMLGLGFIWTLIFLICLLGLFSLRKFFRWLFSWRILKRGLLTAVSLTIVVAVFYAEENWRGHRAWENYRHEWEAKGEKFDFISFAPPTVPDNENFAMAPIVASSYSWLIDEHGRKWATPHTNQVNRLAMERERQNRQYTTNLTVGSWQKATLTNLKLWQDYYRATAMTNIWADWNGTNRVEITPLTTNEFPVASQPQSPAADVLLALSKYDAAIEELRLASKRPHSRFPLDYQTDNPPEILRPHLAALKYCAQVLQLRVIGELQAGQTDKALADVRLMLRLAESTHNEPIMICQLVRMAIVSITLQPIWEGLAEHRWSDAQLKELEQELQTLDFVTDLEFSVRGERAYNLGATEYLRIHRGQEAGFLLMAVCPWFFEYIDKVVNHLPSLPSSCEKYFELIGRLLPAETIGRILPNLPPSGWFDHNKVAIAKSFQEHLVNIGSPEKHLIARQAVLKAREDMDRMFSMKNLTPQNALAHFFLPAISRSADKFSLGQGSVDLALTACGLERYHLAHGEYPETLTALVPQFIEKLPPDVINGQPLHYRRTSDGRFLLYSVGWNGKDDGGVVGLRRSGSVNPEEGDWLWCYPVRN